MTALCITESLMWQRPLLPNTLLSSCTAAHSPWDSAVHSSRFFSSCYTGHGKTHQTTKQKILKNTEGNSQLASSAISAGTNPSKAVLVLSNAGARGGSQKDLAAHRSSPRVELQPDWTSQYSPSTGGTNGTWKYSQSHKKHSGVWLLLLIKKAPILCDHKDFEKSITSAETELNELLYFPIL